MYRIGSIGSGGRGRIAKLAHRPEEGFELAVVCDPRPQALDDYREEYGEKLEVTPDWREVARRSDLDAVFITTPDHMHEEHALAVLESGKAVYLEKPIGITIEQCDRILDAAKRNGNRLYVGHNMRFFPVMQKIKEVIDAGTIGQVQAIWVRHFVDYGGEAYFKNWCSQRANSTGLLLQKGAHDIDMIHWFGGGYTQRTTAMGKLSVYNQVTHRRAPDERGDASIDRSSWPPLTQRGLSPIIDIEDHSMMLMQLDNAVQASYTQCHYTPDGRRNYTIIGTEGRIENVGDQSTEDHEAKVLVWVQRCGADFSRHETLTVPHVPGSHGGADPIIVGDFLAFLKTGRSCGALPIDARMSVAAGVMATQSLRDGNRPFDVPPFVHHA